MTKVKTLTILILATFIYSCGGGSDLAKKKAELEGYKKDLVSLKSKISKLENEIAELDTTTDDGTGNLLVSSYKVEPKPFVHKIEVRGAVASRKNILMSAETMGRIERIPVSEGQSVRKGDLLLQLDSDIIDNNISEIKTQMELAKTVYDRQANLWEKNIGTEIQYLQAKNNYESLERRLETLKSQLSQYYVRAPFSGVVDNIVVKVGEMAQPGLPLIRIMNPNDMYVKGDVSEAHLGRFEKGEVVEVTFPVQDVTLKSSILSVGRVINEQNRTFKVEIALPDKNGYEFRPNQVAILTLTDYKNEEALSVPTNVIQSDATGNFIFTIGSKNGKNIAQKVAVTPGKTFNSMTEIVAGLKGGERVINKGYRNVTHGAEISISTASL